MLGKSMFWGTQRRSEKRTKKTNKGTQVGHMDLETCIGFSFQSASQDLVVDSFEAAADASRLVL